MVLCTFSEILGVFVGLLCKLTGFQHILHCRLQLQVSAARCHWWPFCTVELKKKKVINNLLDSFVNFIEHGATYASDQSAAWETAEGSNETGRGLGSEPCNGFNDAELTDVRLA